MRFALNIAEDGRVMSANELKYTPNAKVVVDAIPPGDIHEYLFIDGVFIHDPIPKEPEPEQPTPVDYEARIVALEEQLVAAKILLGVE